MSSFSDYATALDPRTRAALQTLRKRILAAAPGAEECTSYGLPAFRLDGNVLVALGAASKHCSLFLMSGTIVASLRADLAAYSTSKGTVRFPPDKPLPAALVKKLVHARIAENARRAPAPTPRRSTPTRPRRPKR